MTYTLDTFAAEMGVTRFLAEDVFGATEDAWPEGGHERPAIRIPSVGVDGTEVTAQFRLEDGSKRWAPGRGVYPFGLHQLNDQDRRLVLVEGARDAMVGFLCGLNVVGLPSSTVSGTEKWWAAFEAYETVLVVKEPDSGGERLLHALNQSPIADRVHILDLGSDLTDLFEAIGHNPESLARRIDEATAQAPTLAESLTDLSFRWDEEPWGVVAHFADEAHMVVRPSSRIQGKLDIEVCDADGQLLLVATEDPNSKGARALAAELRHVHDERWKELRHRLRLLRLMRLVVTGQAPSAIKSVFDLPDIEESGEPLSSHDIVRGEPSVLIGPPTAGKSLHVAVKAVAIASGMPVGPSYEAGPAEPVLIIPSEGNDSRWKEWIEAIMRGLGQPNLEPPIDVRRLPGPLVQNIDTLARWVQDEGYSALFVDTLSGAREPAADIHLGTDALFAALESLPQQLAVQVTDHISQDAEANIGQENWKPLGTGKTRARVRQIWSAKAVERAPGSITTRMHRNEANYAPAGTEMVVRLDFIMSTNAKRFQKVQEIHVSGGTYIRRTDLRNADRVLLAIQNLPQPTSKAVHKETDIPRASVRNTARSLYREKLIREPETGAPYRLTPAGKRAAEDLAEKVKDEGESDESN